MNSFHCTSSYLGYLRFDSAGFADATTRRGSSGCPQTGGRRWGGRALQRSAAPRSVGVTMAMAARWQRLVVKRHNDGGGAVPHRCGWGQPAGDPPPAGSGLRREGNDRGAAGATPAVTPPSRAPPYDTPFPGRPAPTSQDRPHAVAWGGQEGGGGVGPLCCWRACPRALLLLPLSHCLSPLFFFFPLRPRPTTRGRLARFSMSRVLLLRRARAPRAPPPRDVLAAAAPVWAWMVCVHLRWCSVLNLQYRRRHCLDGRWGSAGASGLLGGVREGRSPRPPPCPPPPAWRDCRWVRHAAVAAAAALRHPRRWPL